MPILTLNNVSLTFFGHPVLDNASWTIKSRDRIALVGRNGAGKSTLLNILQGKIEPDVGQVHRRQGLRIASLAQDVPVHVDQTVYQIMVSGLGETGQVLYSLHTLSATEDHSAWVQAQQRLDELHAWDVGARLEALSVGLGLNVNASMQSLSGGMKRRALLAAALLTQPDLLLLVEPTNHLDLTAIEWLEGYLKTYTGSVVMVTHDRTFLTLVADIIVDIDRGHLSFYPCDYATYLVRRDAALLAEQTHDRLFDQKLSAEEVWLRTGVKARRTRNEGRVRALKDMRETHQQRRVLTGQVKPLSLEVSRSGTVVMHAENVSYSFTDAPIVEDFSCLIRRGEKIGIVGANGSGKTTLVRLLLKTLEPQSGTVVHGTGLEITYFDQLRGQLNDNETVMANVASGAEHVTLHGKQQHVASYLRDFLFTPDRFNQPVSVLSGGERHRLLLAKLFAKPVNVLVMDEPTNDLDIDTLELLESLLMAFTGTLLLISHDRMLINHVVTRVLVSEDKGQWMDLVGNHATYQAFKESQFIDETRTIPEVVVPKVSVGNKLSFTEQRELAKLPAQITAIERAIAKIQDDLGHPDRYQQPKTDIIRIKQQLEEREQQLSELELRWELLEGRS